MEVGSSSLPGTTSWNSNVKSNIYNIYRQYNYGGLAQLARAPALQAGGQRFESVILHTGNILINLSICIPHRSLTYWHKQNCKVTKVQNFEIRIARFNDFAKQLKVWATSWHLMSCWRKKVRKGVWWMPRLTETMKDVISCDKLRVGANNLWSGDFRMGQPVSLKDCHSR